MKQPPSRKAGDSAREAARKWSCLDVARGRGREAGEDWEAGYLPPSRHSARHSDLTLGDSCPSACFPEQGSKGQRAPGAGPGSQSWETLSPETVRTGTRFFLTAELMLPPLPQGSAFRFPVKHQTANVFGFADQMVSAASTHLCYFSAKKQP